MFVNNLRVWANAKHANKSFKLISIVYERLAGGYGIGYSELMRPILSFNEDESLYQIWEKMLEKREHISIIVDPHGLTIKMPKPLVYELTSEA